MDVEFLPKSKVCFRCKQEKSKSEFHLNSRSKDGFSSWCKACQRDNMLRRRYNMTLTQYNQKLKEQNGVCAICGEPEITKRGDEIDYLSVDHVEKPFKVRDLLCGLCNRGLGGFRDNSKLLRQAILYLRRHQCK